MKFVIYNSIDDKEDTSNFVQSDSSDEDGYEELPGIAEGLTVVDSSDEIDEKFNVFSNRYVHS